MNHRVPPKPTQRRSAARTVATAFAPASVGNTAVGFDVLGFAFPVRGDHVTLERTDETPELRVGPVTAEGAVIPSDPQRNTASAAARALLAAEGVVGSYRLHIEKGVPLSAGMGGSSASAVAGVVAANALLESPLPRVDLLRFALEGEAVASGGHHSDNVAPSLLGGLTATEPGPEPRVVHLPVPPEIRCVLVRPHLAIDTLAAREVLSPEVRLADHVKQSASLALFVAALHQGDLELLRASMHDWIVEPQRGRLIPGFAAAKAAALEAGALGCSIAGSGPSVFAWVVEGDATFQVRDALVHELGRNGVQTDSWIAPPGGAGASLVDRE